MKKFKGVSWNYMPQQLKEKLIKLHKKTGYIYFAYDREGPWHESKRMPTFRSDTRYWHPGLN